MSNCCPPQKPIGDTDTESCCTPKKRFDYLLWVSLAFVVLFYLIHLVEASLFIPLTKIRQFGDAVFHIMNQMAWGLALGIFMVALLARIPKELVMAVMGTDKGVKGILRATSAGLLLDLCSHGILMVGAKLYERGASLGQVMAFLIASPWNSISLTIILIALIGLPWTLVFVVGSAFIAVVSGCIFDLCVKRGVLNVNPNSVQLPENFHFWSEIKLHFSLGKFSVSNLLNFFVVGVKESTMVVRWLMVGVLLASAIRVFVPEDYFGNYFGPTLIGMTVTLVTATILEICSEGSAPIAADIFNRAGAPGNSFTFLMAGVSTDYTEIMVLKDTTRSWKIALFLPLITLPQIVLLAVIFNQIS